MKVYGVYYLNFNDDDMQVFTEKEKAQEFFEKIKNDLKEYETEYNKEYTENTDTTYSVSFYDWGGELETYFVKLKEFEI